MSAPGARAAGLRVGIDVGGTHTDAVLVSGDRVLHEVKAPTTRDVTGGVVGAMTELVDACAPHGRIEAVMIGTTHFTNAVVERKRLLATACIRLALPATTGLGPLIDWPRDLIDAVQATAYMCHGGFEVDGREVSAIDPAELREVADDLRRRNIATVAVTSVFSPMISDHEQAAASILEAELPGLHVTLSHEIGRLGLVERENAAVMNASLRGLATEIVDALETSLAELGIDAPLFLTQNDGTLMTVDHARRYPVATFASGPTNSMRGAATLADLDDCIVVDIGGTTSDVGLVQRGFPREAPVAATVGGVRTNFRMPAVVSVGIGGGSVVRGNGGELTVGPDSVGYELTTRARVFGGDVLTATDVAVAAGRCQIGDPARVADLDPDLVRAALTTIETEVAAAIDRVRTGPRQVSVVIVGGGSVLIGDSLPGVDEVVRPARHAVANAIGGATAKVGGQVDRVFSLEERSREEVLDEARELATAEAIASGARSETIRVVDLEDLPLAYLPTQATRVRMKVVGDFAIGEVPVAAHD